MGPTTQQAWVTAKFSEYIRNSVVLTAITIAGLVVISTLAAYAFARMEFPGRDAIFGLLLSTMMIPATVTMIPNFLTITGNNPLLPFIKWYDNWPALTIPFMAGFFNIFMLRQFFAQVPNELWDASQIDGAGHLRFLIQIVLPLSAPPLTTVVIFSFISSWNSLLWPLIATQRGVRLVAGLGGFAELCHRGRAGDTPLDGRSQHQHAAGADPVFHRTKAVHRGHCHDGTQGLRPGR